ncbi:patatin-like phospholipase family protein [bacterium]|nr:patatin-like phospholipase family protein [bacterium]
MDLSQKKKIAFICSGGAVKAAAFHAGVALALERVGFRFHGGTEGQLDAPRTIDPSRLIQVYVGSSAGSLVATYLAQGGRLKDLVALYRRDKNIEGIPGLKYRQMLAHRLTGPKGLFDFNNLFMAFLKNRSLQSPFSTHGIRDYLSQHVIQTDKFSGLKPDLFVVATEVNEMRKVVFSRYKSAPASSYLEYRNDVSVSDACAASMALPPIYHPYTIQIEGKGRDYFDGEIQEPLSAHIGRDVDCDLVICSYTHQAIRVPQGQSISSKGMLSVSLQAIYQSIEQKIRVARGYRKQEKKLLDTVHKFFKQNNLSQELEEKLCQELEARMTYKSHMDYIYIHPKASDVQMFNLPHFSMNRKHTETIVKKGYLAGLSSMRGLKTQLD